MLNGAIECPTLGARTVNTSEDSEGTAVERERPKRAKKHNKP
jgi:hypothetical protein